MSKQNFIALAALAALGFATAAQAEDFPKRKPGLWEMTMQMDGAPAGMPGMRSQHCVDEKSDEAMQRKAMTNNDAKQQCTQGAIKKISGGVEMEASCKSDEGRMDMVSRMTGDMGSAYTVDSRMKFTPPRHGMSETHMTMKATHAGKCPADMKPGEVRMGGMSFTPGQGGRMDMKNMDPEAMKKWAEEMQKAQPKK